MSDPATRGRNNRRRGQSGEREVVGLIRDDLGLHLKGRNLGQERDSGHDVNLGHLRVEVKRRKKVANLYEWLENSDIAMLRADGKGWLVVMEWPLFVKLSREEIINGSQRRNPASPHTSSAQRNEPVEGEGQGT